VLFVSQRNVLPRAGTQTGVGDIIQASSSHPRLRALAGVGPALLLPGANIAARINQIASEASNGRAMSQSWRGLTRVRPRVSEAARLLLARILKRRHSAQRFLCCTG
jgi:hypothetical protein